MLNYKKNDTFLTNYDRGDVIYKNHSMEFLRFFESHKRLCDEIGGLKYHSINSNGKEHKILISNSNFIYGIKKLNSFIIDYLHYIEDKTEETNIINEFEKLEYSYIHDEEYNLYIKKKGNLSESQKIIFNRKYVYYLSKAFEISYLMSKILQKSLNIAPRELIKNIQFVNYDGFFNNLSSYREEMAHELSNLSYGLIYDNFKKILGYFYTYRHLMMSREQKHCLKLLKLIHNYITIDEVAKIIVKLNSGDEITNTQKEDINKDFIVIRNAFNKVYYLVNYSLSMKNILPKSTKDVLIDTTLI